jgi:hypothetical protein
VPDTRPVFRQVARVLRSGGVYHVQCANPFVCGLTGADWTGAGYMLRRPYVDGAVIEYADEPWVYRDAAPAAAAPAPREYRHSLSTLMNGLIEHGFVIQRVADAWAMAPDPATTPGSWRHQIAFAPPSLAFWTLYRPTVSEADADAR